MNAEIQTTRNIPPLQGVTGRKLRLLGLTYTSLRIGDNNLKVKMVVVPDYYLGNPILLGMDVLGRIPFTIDQRIKKLTLDQTSYPLKVTENCFGKVRRIRTLTTSPSSLQGVVKRKPT